MKLEDEQVTDYFTQVLGIDNWKQLFTTDPVLLLHTIVTRQVTRVYFHSLHVTAIPKSERKVPTEEEIVSTSLRGLGGNCLHVNYFMGLFLKAVGYNVTTIGGTIGLLPRNHVMTIVKTSESESYLVDVGCGCPTSWPIPLHSLPFTVPSCGGSTIEFRQVNETEFAKMQIGGGFFRKKLDSNLEEKPLITFDLTPKVFDDFQISMHYIWTDDLSPFTRNLFLFRHYYAPVGVSDVIIENYNGDTNAEVTLEFILIFGPNVLFGSDSKRKVEQFPSYESMLPLIFKYFPNVDREMLAKSIEFLNTVTPIDVRL